MPQCRVCGCMISINASGKANGIVFTSRQKYNCMSMSFEDSGSLAFIAAIFENSIF